MLSQMAGCPPLSWLNNIPFCICTSLLSFHLLSINLGCFHILATLSNAVINTGVHIAPQIPVFISLGIYPGVELLAHMVELFLIWWKPPYCFP